MLKNLCKNPFRSYVALLQLLKSTKPLPCKLILFVEHNNTRTKGNCSCASSRIAFLEAITSNVNNLISLITTRTLALGSSFYKLWNKKHMHVDIILTPQNTKKFICFKRFCWICVFEYLFFLWLPTSTNEIANNTKGATTKCIQNAFYLIFFIWIIQNASRRRWWWKRTLSFSLVAFLLEA